MDHSSHTNDHRHGHYGREPAPLVAYKGTLARSQLDTGKTPVCGPEQSREVVIVITPDEIVGRDGLITCSASLALATPNLCADIIWICVLDY